MLRVNIFCFNNYYFPPLWSTKLNGALLTLFSLAFFLVTVFITKTLQMTYIGTLEFLEKDKFNWTCDLFEHRAYKVHILLHVLEGNPEYLVTRESNIFAVPAKYMYSIWHNFSRSARWRYFHLVFCHNLSMTFIFVCFSTPIWMIPCLTYCLSISINSSYIHVLVLLCISHLFLGHVRVNDVKYEHNPRPVSTYIHVLVLLCISHLFLGHVRVNDVKYEHNQRPVSSYIHVLV
jgi:hypothetical protein